MQVQRGVTVLFASLAAPNPSTVTVTPLYGCGHLLEIKGQATEGVGCDLMCAFHITSPCHMAMFFLLLCTLTEICCCLQYLCIHTVGMLLHVIANMRIHKTGSRNWSVYVCVSVCMC